MQEINLLQTKVKDRSYEWQKRNKLFMTILSLLLVFELALLGTIYILKGMNGRKIAAFEQANTQIQTELNKRQQNLGASKDLQAQLTNMRTVINNHIYWSGFFDELSGHTYSKAQFVTLQANNNGELHVEGIVSSYTDLGRLILGMTSSKQFSNVKLLSVQPSSGLTAGYLFSLNLTVSKEIFQK